MIPYPEVSRKQNQYLIFLVGLLSYYLIFTSRLLVSVLGRLGPIPIVIDQVFQVIVLIHTKTVLEIVSQLTTANNTKTENCGTDVEKSLETFHDFDDVIDIVDIAQLRVFQTSEGGEVSVELEFLPPRGSLLVCELQFQQTDLAQSRNPS
uniref:Uncharacterized protein n=1 Tax=Cacopsylla melanoneura TaxID=428564 RepID=A0A8D8QZY0_9HEMI